MMVEISPNQFRTKPWTVKSKQIVEGICVAALAGCLICLGAALDQLVHRSRAQDASPGPSVQDDNTLSLGRLHVTSVFGIYSDKNGLPDELLFQAIPGDYWIATLKESVAPQKRSAALTPAFEPAHLVYNKRSITNPERADHSTFDCAWRVFAVLAAVATIVILAGWLSRHDDGCGE